MEQMSSPKTKYIVKTLIDLRGETIDIPPLSTIYFKGGKFINGTINGNETTLIGDISLDSVSGSFKNKIFKSSWSTHPCNFEKALGLFALDVPCLLIDEDFVIDRFEGSIKSSIRQIIGDNISFSIKCDLTKSDQKTPDYLFLFQSPVERITGINADFNNFAARGLIRIQKTARNCSIDDIIIKNISCARNSCNTDVNCIDVSVSDNSLTKIQRIAIANISNGANDIIGDSYGSLMGLYVNAKAGFSFSLDISKCTFSEIHNYKNGTIVLEDSGGIYVSEGFPVNNNSRVYIHDISGQNYGKRLIKTDCSNIKIENIRGKSIYDDTMSLISLNSGSSNQYKNATVKSVFFEGVAVYVVASSISNNHFSNIYTNFKRTASPYSCALYIPSDCIAENLVLRGAQQIAIIDNGRKAVSLKGIDYDDLDSDNSLYANAAFITSDAVFTLSDISIKTKRINHLFVDNYPNRRSSELNLSGVVTHLNYYTTVDSRDYLIQFGESSRDSHLSFNDCHFEFEGSARGLFGIEPSKSNRNHFTLKFSNVDVLYKRVEPYCVPLGSVSITDETSIELRDVRVRNTSPQHFSSDKSGLYLKNNRTNSQSTIDNILIDKCFIENTPITNKENGIDSTGQNIRWRTK